jgi:hypothetical protein
MGLQVVQQVVWDRTVARVLVAAVDQAEVPVVVPVVVLAEVPVELHGIDDACSGRRNIT